MDGYSSCSLLIRNLVHKTLGSVEPMICNKALLEKYVYWILGEEYCSALKSFFTRINKTGRFDYRVFIARRVLTLAEIFLKLDDKELGEIPGICTDSTILPLCSEIAEEYLKTGIMPRVLLVDDLLIFGNGVGTILRAIEEQLLTELKDSGIEEAAIRAAIAEAVEIRVFAKSKSPSVLPSRYQSRLVAQVLLDDLQWHQFSDKVARLIRVVGVSNSCMTGPVQLPDSCYQALLSNLNHDYHEQTCTYDMLCQRSLISVRADLHAPKYIVTIRMTPSEQPEDSSPKDWSLLPLLILPVFSEPDFLCLQERILARLNLPEVSELFRKDWSSCYRIRHEMISFILSVQAFFAASDTLTSRWSLLKDRTPTTPLYNLDKLRINFGTAFYPCVDSVFETVYRQPLFTWQELCDLLDECTANSSPLYRKAAFGTEPASFDRCMRLCEDVFYETGILQRVVSLRKKPSPLLPAFEESGSLSSHPLPLPVILQELMNRMEAVEESAVYKIVAYFLQFLDSGVTALIARGKESLGYSHCIRAGEQSLFLYPRRYYRFISGLVRIAEHCRQFGSDQTQDILRFAESVGEPECGEGLLRFMKLLELSNQKIEDWDFNISERSIYTGESESSNQGVNNQLFEILKIEHTQTQYDLICRKMYQ